MKLGNFKAVIAVALIFMLRLLGLFMILPVFSAYTEHFSHSTPYLIGLALGIYGLSQASLQIPLGMASDRIGRKPIILLGLIIFILGSIVSGTSDTIYGVIFGRFLQGCGAIGSTLVATVADLTTDDERTAAMAIVGVSIGIAFSLALLLGPILAGVTGGVRGLFFFTAGFGTLAILILYTLVPTPPKPTFHAECETKTSLIASVLRNKALVKLDIGIFLQHAILTATFVALPVIITHERLIPTIDQWKIYLPVLLLGFIIGISILMVGERKKRGETVFLAAIAALAIGLLVLYFNYTTIIGLIAGLFIFFTGFNMLEASLPSLVSKKAPTTHKGTALGVYSSAQFLGLFTGGSLGGALYAHYHPSVIFLACSGLAMVWFAITVMTREEVR